ncbi:MAG TPA: cation transporting ATPase C-terminal domain-containing protein, partial [Candidatus Norongarragalinales archaeon]|nr:cation transporting ATPase C-terminal domain-containing protein [Candidatus Norongarragalinales archaeon]
LAALVAVALQLAIHYTPFFESIFSTKPLLYGDLALAFAIASLGFIIPEAAKLIRRARRA